MAHPAPSTLPSNFSDLSNYTTIIFYDEDHPVSPSFKDYLIPTYCILNLSADPLLKRELTDLFNLVTLPAILINGTVFFVGDKIQKTHTDQRVVRLVNDLLVDNENVIFIKGTPTRPECGFTSKLVDLLDEAGLTGKYAYFNIFEDEGVRQELKKLNGWPTYPQVYLKRRFVGGLDTIRDMKMDGKLN